MPFNEERYHTMIDKMHEDQQRDPDHCYWEGCMEPREVGQLYCRPHGYRAASIDVFLWPGKYFHASS